MATIDYDADALLAAVQTTAANKSNADLGNQITLAAAAAGTFTGATQVNAGGRGLIVVLDITVATTTSVVLSIYGVDAASGKRWLLLASAAKTGVATTILAVNPASTAASNTVAQSALPYHWCVEAVVTGASSALTATVGANVTQ